MNKKNILLALALPCLLLSACGGEKNGNASSSGDVDSSIAYGKVNEEGWAKAFSSVNNFTASSIVTRSEGISRVLTCLTSSAMRMSQYSGTVKGGKESLVSEIYATKEGESNVEYDYVPEYQLYAKKTIQGESSYSKFSSSLIEIFKSSYSSFSYVTEKQGYFASSLSAKVNGQSYLSKDVLIRFSSGKLADIDFDACDDLTGSTLSHGYISEFGSTTITLPDSSKIKSGLLTGQEGWSEAFLALGDSKNATIQSVSSSEGEDTTSKKSEFTSSAVRLTSSSTDVYYSIVGDQNYVYTKDENGLYAKKSVDSSEGFYEELDSLANLLGTSYELFAYDKSKDSYTASSIDLPMEFGASYTNVEASFSGGHLSSLSYDYGDAKVSVSEVGTTVVTLPSGDKVYSEGKVDEAKWKAAFQKAADDLNFICDAKYAYEDSYYSYSVEDKYVCAESAIEYTDEQDYGGELSASHCFYSSEDGNCYKWSGDGDETTWKKEKVEAGAYEPFADMKSKISALADSYSSFEFDEASCAFKKDTLAVNSSTYSDVLVSFKGDSLSEIQYKCDGYDYAFSSFGEAQVTLPTIA